MMANASTETVAARAIDLDRHQSIRAEIITRGGKPIVSIARWKNTPAGARRTGQGLEFGAHRLQAVLHLLARLATQQSCDPDEAAPAPRKGVCK